MPAKNVEQASLSRLCFQVMPAKERRTQASLKQYSASSNKFENSRGSLLVVWWLKAGHNFEM